MKTFEAAMSYCQSNEINCTRAKSVADLMKLLDAGFTDAVLVSTNSLGRHICQLTKKAIYYAPIKEMNIEMFHYLHPSNQQLLEPLSQIFESQEIQSLLTQIKSLWTALAQQCGKQLLKVQLSR